MLAAAGLEPACLVGPAPTEGGGRSVSREIPDRHGFSRAVTARHGTQACDPAGRGLRRLAPTFHWLSSWGPFPGMLLLPSFSCEKSQLSHSALRPRSLGVPRHTCQDLCSCSDTVSAFFPKAGEEGGYVLNKACPRPVSCGSYRDLGLRRPVPDLTRDQSFIKSKRK